MKGKQGETMLSKIYQIKVWYIQYIFPKPRKAMYMKTFISLRNAKKFVAQFDGCEDFATFYDNEYTWHNEMLGRYIIKSKGQNILSLTINRERSDILIFFDEMER
jgi:hypothetical protein